MNPDSCHTVYPARAGAFPAASFFSLADAFRHVRGLSDTAPTGICICPATSYDVHLLDTEVNPWLES